MITSERLADKWNALAAKVISITFQGASLRIKLDLGGQEILSEVPNGPQAPRLEEGQEITVGWSSEAALALPPKPDA